MEISSIFKQRLEVQYLTFIYAKLTDQYMYKVSCTRSYVRIAIMDCVFIPPPYVCMFYSNTTRSIVGGDIST